MLLGCLDRPSGGKLWLDKERIDTLGERAKARLRRDRIGFVFQGFHLMDELTARENVELPTLLAGQQAGSARRRAMALLEQVGPADRADHLPSALSGGQRQRVASSAVAYRGAIALPAGLGLFDALNHSNTAGPTPAIGLAAVLPATVLTADGLTALTDRLNNHRTIAEILHAENA